MFDESTLSNFTPEDEEKSIKPRERTDRKRPARTDREKSGEKEYRSQYKSTGRNRSENRSGQKPQAPQQTKKSKTDAEHTAAPKEEKKEGGKSRNYRRRYYRGGKKSSGGQTPNSGN